MNFRVKSQTEKIEIIFLLKFLLKNHNNEEISLEKKIVTLFGKNRKHFWGKNFEQRVNEEFSITN